MGGVLIFALLWVCARAQHGERAMTPLWENFNAMRDSLPKKTMTDILQIQEMLLKAVDTYRDYQHRLLDFSDDDYRFEYPYYMDMFDPNQMAPQLKKSNKELRNETAKANRDARAKNPPLVSDLHTNVVFVGFPATAVEMIRNSWFEGLGREDHVLASYGETGDTIKMPGFMKNQHHLHIIQTSFHVADVLTSLYEKLLDRGKLNIMEIESVLESLAMVIADAHVAKSGSAPAATIFALNLKLPFSYEYRAGFDPESIRQLRRDPEIVKMCRKALADIKRSTRIEVLPDAPPSKTNYDTALDADSSMHHALRVLQGVSYEDSSRRFTQPDTGSRYVILKDMVKETRAWAAVQSARLKDADYSLRARFVAILSPLPGDPVSTPSSRASARFALARSILFQPNSITPQPCTSSSWIGSDRLLWTDIRASSEFPREFSSLVSKSSSATPAPRALDESEWLHIGALNSKRDISKEISRGRKALGRHMTAIKNFYAQASCPAEIMDDATSEYLHEDDISVSRFFAQMTYSLSSYGRTRVKPSCAAFAIQVAFLSFAEHCSKKLESHMFNSTKQPTIAENEDESLSIEETITSLSPYLREAQLMHLRSLTEVLDASNVLTTTPHAHSGVVTHDAAIFLGYLGSLTLDAVRSVVGAPLRLHLDAFNAQLPSFAYSTGIRSPVVVGLDGVEKMAKLSRAWSGESLLDYVRGAETRDRRTYGNLAGGVLGYDPMESLSGKSADPLPNGESALWMHTLPPILFPTKIDVLLYVVQLQSTYLPLTGSHIGSGASSGAASNESPDSIGLDHGLVTQQLLRLKLPSQALTLSVEYINADTSGRPSGNTRNDHDNTDSQLKLAIITCMRTVIIPLTTDRASAIQSKQATILDSHCVWALLQHYDEDSLTLQQRASRPGAATRKKSSVQHVPIFLLSMDHTMPVYLDKEFHFSAAVGHAVLVVQNSQSGIGLGYTCASTTARSDEQSDIHRYADEIIRHEVVVNGRDPIKSLLAAAGQVISGLGPIEGGKCGKATQNSLVETIAAGGGTGINSQSNKIAAFRSSLFYGHTYAHSDPHHQPPLEQNFRQHTVFQGLSPSTGASSSDGSFPVYSALEIDAAFRSRVMRALGVARELFKKKFPLMTIEPSGSVETDDPNAPKTQTHHPLSGLYNQALMSLEMQNFQKAASLSNSLLFILSEIDETGHPPPQFRPFLSPAPHAPPIPPSTTSLSYESAGTSVLDVFIFCTFACVAYVVAGMVIGKSSTLLVARSSGRGGTGIAGTGKMSAPAVSLFSPTTTKYNEL